MRLSIVRPTLVGILLVLASVSHAVAQGGQPASSMTVVGYADRLSVQQGETIRFMVSSKLSRYRADIVRLIHGDTNPRGPGFKEQLVDAVVNKEYDGQYQELPNGSYVTVPDSPALRRTGSFTIAAWIAPTTPDKGAQGIVTKWSESDRSGYALVIDRDGLGLWLGDKGKVEKVSTGTPIRGVAPALVWAGGHQMTNTTNWCFVAAVFDATAGKVTLYQEPQNAMPLDTTRAMVDKTVTLKSAGASDAPLLVAALWAWRDAAIQKAGGHFNGKIETPTIFGRALAKTEIDALRQGQAVRDPIAAWDFEANMGSRRVSDTSPNLLHGQTVQMPARAVTGHTWSGRETAYQRAKGEYGAIYFHDDDLDDAGWKLGFEYRVPATLKSGVYAARLRAGNAEDYVPFYVRPKKGTATAKIAFLVPTFSYLAYANSGANDPQLLSLYNFHSDGSGVSYSTMLRPILNMRPKFYTISRINGERVTHQLPADLNFIDWLEAKGHQYDVITDQDLDEEGVSVLAPYKVVLTGSHPEYWSGKMLDGLEQYLDRGGRFMYLGGNGLYWVTSMDPEGHHTVEVRRRDGTEVWEAAPGEYFHSTTGEFGGLWRFRGRPPQKMVGAGFAAQANDTGRPYQRQPASFDPRAAWIFEGIGPDELIGDFPSLVLGYGAAGLEVDRFDQVLGTPPHALLLATASGFSDAYQHVVEEVLQSNSKQSGSINPYVRGDIVYFETPKGGAVFSISSISYSGSLSYNNYTNNVSRMTDNVLRRFAADAPIAVPPSGVTPAK